MVRLTLLFALAGGADLEDLARRLQLTWTTDPGSGRHVVRTERTTIVFSPGLDLALVNGTPRRLFTPVTLEGGRVKLPPDLASLVEQGALAKGADKPEPKPPAPYAPRNPPRADPKPKPILAGRIIAIDPGHGGIWTGFVGRSGVMEKDINLDVSLELQRILESWGATVVMTRMDDRHFSANRDDDLQHRVNAVNRSGADVFLSIHTNGVEHNAGARGFEVWVPITRGPRDDASRDLARQLRAELSRVWSSEDRGTKDEHNLYVLKNTHCPAALVEMEFVSNPAAERELAKSSVRRRLAEAIAEGARRWLLRR